MTRPLFVLVLAPALAAATVSCGNSKAESAKNAKSESAVYVKTETIRLREFSETIKVTGNVESMADVVVPAEETGRLVRWYVPKGQPVRSGEVLAQIDDVLLRAAFDAADANYKMAEVNYEKQKQAYEEQAVSELQLKNLEYQRDAARAQAEMARHRLEKTKIVSPIDGVLNDRLVDAGEMIAAGSPAAHVVDVQHLKIAAGIPERYAADLAVGTTVEFTVDALPGEMFAGRIGFVGASVQMDNRTIPTEIYLTETDGRLKPFMIARLLVRLKAGLKAVAVDHDLIQQIDVNRVVVYIARNGMAEERIVRVGGTDGRYVRILEGLREGDELITVGYQNLVNNQKIIVQD
jgi:membrane fusion protein (multidrug efflux system)